MTSEHPIKELGQAVHQVGAPYVEKAEVWWKNHAEERKKLYKIAIIGAGTMAVAASVTTIALLVFMKKKNWI